MGRRPEDGAQYGKKPMIDRIMEKYAKTPGAEIEAMNLDEEEERILQRWIFIDGLMRKHRPNLKMADIENITRSRFDISHGQFWVDIKNTDRLFGTLMTKSKEYQKSIYVEHLEQVATLAEAAGDFKTAVKAISEAAKLRGLYEKEELPPPSDKPAALVMIINGQNNNLNAPIDLDKLNETRPELFEKILQIADVPTFGTDKMKSMLEHGQ